VRSVLTWNLENWPQGRLNRYEDNANYSCRSSANSVGPGVHSATHFRVEYPPDSLYVSLDVVNVLEHDTPERVLCSAQAYPEATYMWRFNDQVIQTHNVLYFNGPVSRDQAGVYVCEAQNRHGTAFVTARLNVMYRPECRISQEKSGDGADGGDEEVGTEGGIRLVCTAEANPPEVSFQWRRGNSSAAVDFDGEAVTFAKGRQQSSMLVVSLEQQQQVEGGGFGTFHCFVNNSLGLGVPCEMDVQGLPVGLVRSVSNTNIIVIVAVIAAGLVAAALVATTVIVCRRWRVPEEKQKKCANNSEDRDRNENEVSGLASGPGVAATAGSQQPPQPIHKWPLRPGVHVHVNGLNTLTGGPAAGLQAQATAAASSKLNHQINGFSYGATKSSRSSSSSGSDWASNASSNPELSSTAELDPLKRQQQLAGRLSAGKSAAGVLATHPELPGDTATASSSASSSSTASTGVEAAKELSASTGSRPASRLRKSRREAAQSGHSTSGGQPAYYENVSYNPANKQKQLDLMMLQRRSQSPSLGAEHQSEDEGGGGLRSRHSSGCNLRPVSQMSGHGNGSLYAFGSNRSSRAGSVPRTGAAAPSPSCSLHPAYRASLGRTTNHRAYGEQVHDHHHDHHHHHQHGRHRTLHHSSGYAGRQEAAGEPLQLTPEAEVETDSDLSQERNLLIEYTTHVPYSAYSSHDTPILSSLLHSQSLAKTAALGRYGGGVGGGGPLDYGSGGGPSLLLLTEPISPPKQFDTSPRTSARESTY
jgi:hypothetical protein